MADSAEEFVYIRGKGQGDDVLPGRVTRQAFDTIWQGKGYTVVPDDEAELAGSPATQAEVAAGAAESTTTRKKG